MGSLKEKKTPSELIDPRTNEADVAEYYNLSVEIKELENRKWILNKVIKNYFNNSPGIYTIGDYQVNLYEQDKSKMDEDRLLSVLKEKGLHDCIKLKMVPDETKIEEALYKGLITQEELSHCIISNKILALMVTKRGENKKRR